MRLRRQLEARQLEWAHARGIPLRRGVEGEEIGQVENLDDNFRVPLDEDIRRQFLHGSGGELAGPEGASGHLYSLASSSALAVNFLEPWRRGGQEPLLEALGLRDHPGGMLEFDYRLRFGKKAADAPTLDALVRPRAQDSPVIAFEVKFCESWDGKPRPGLSEQALKRQDLLDGWPGLRRLALEIRHPRDPVHSVFGAAQAIREAMVLRRHFGRNGFVLVHLWYDIGGRDGSRYRAEVEEFSFRARKDGVAFAARTWQELFRSAEAWDTDADWVSYLAGRYQLKSAQ